MSIIYDALKKVEGAIHRSAPQANAPIVSLKHDFSFKEHPVVMLSAILIICSIGAGVSFFFLSQKKPENKSPIASTNIRITPRQELPTLSITPAPPAVQAVLEEIPVPVSSPEPPSPQLNNVVLNGVFFSQNEGYALLNNQIVKKGDTVEGATVKEISEEGVVLETAGSTIKLTNNRR